MEQPLIVLKQLTGNAPPTLSALQSMLVPHVELLTEIWVSVWITTAGVLLWKLFKAYREQRGS